GSYRPENDLPSRTEAESNQGAGRYSCSRPENGNSLWLGQQRKAQPRCREIDDADRKGERDRAQPRCQIETDRPHMPNLRLWVLKHQAILAPYTHNVPRPTPAIGARSDPCWTESCRQR